MRGGSRAGGNDCTLGSTIALAVDCIHSFVDRVDFLALGLERV